MDMSYMIEAIYLDLDGVCCDFPLGVARLFLPEDEAQILVANWKTDKKDISDLLGIHVGQMWSAIDRTENFWYNLELYEWTKDLCKYLHTVTSEVFVCTSPSQNPNCVVGKLNWLSKHKLVKHRNYFITPHKHMLANPNAVLIDDDDKKCNTFLAWGGKVIQFPQGWGQNYNAVLNDGRPAIDNKLEYVKERIVTLNRPTSTSFREYNSECGLCGSLTCRGGCFK